jgi:hypothetical protein
MRRPWPTMRFKLREAGLARCPQNQPASKMSVSTSSEPDTHNLGLSGIWPGAAEETTQGTINNHTRLNTRLTASVTHPSRLLVVYLEDALTIDELFADASQGWHSAIRAESDFHGWAKICEMGPSKIFWWNIGFDRPAGLLGRGAQPQMRC